jgi:hypothetical protein
LDFCSPRNNQQTCIYVQSCAALVPAAGTAAAAAAALQGIPPMKEGGKRVLLIPAGTPQHSQTTCTFSVCYTSCQANQWQQVYVKK